MNANTPHNSADSKNAESLTQQVPQSENMGSKPATQKTERVYKPLENTFSGLLLFWLASCVVLLLVFWPYTFGSKSALQAPTKITYLGVLQKINFVGGFGTDTQIQIEGRTLLLHGVKNLKPGVVLETRVDFFGKWACEVGTDSCYGFAGQD